MENNPVPYLTLERDKVPWLWNLFLGRKRATKCWHAAFDRMSQKLRFGIQPMPKFLGEGRLRDPDDPA